MVDEDFKLYNVLMDTILPNLNRIQASQNEQRLQTDRLSQNLEEFRQDGGALC